MAALFLAIQYYWRFNTVAIIFSGLFSRPCPSDISRFTLILIIHSCFSLPTVELLATKEAIDPTDIALFWLLRRLSLHPFPIITLKQIIQLIMTVRKFMYDQRRWFLVERTYLQLAWMFPKCPFLKGAFIKRQDSRWRTIVKFTGVYSDIIRNGSLSKLGDWSTLNHHYHILSLWPAERQKYVQLKTNSYNLAVTKPYFPPVNLIKFRKQVEGG